MARLVTTARGRSLREQHRQGTDQAIRHLMIGIAANPITLLEVVAQGHLQFRDNFLRDLRGWAVTGEIADSVFNFFCDQLIRRFGPDADAKTLLDSEAIAALADEQRAASRPPTEAEIEAAWEFGDSHSSEEGKRFFYQDIVGPPIVVNTKVH